MGLEYSPTFFSHKFGMPNVGICSIDAAFGMVVLVHFWFSVEVCFCLPSLDL